MQIKYNLADPKNISFPSAIPDKVLDLIIENYSLANCELQEYAKKCPEFISDLKQRIIAAYFDEIADVCDEVVVPDSRVIAKLIKQTLESDTNEPIIIYLRKWITIVALNYLMRTFDKCDTSLLYDVNSNPKLCYTKQEENI